MTTRVWTEDGFYHAPSAAHPARCGGCTADESKHGKPYSNSKATKATTIPTLKTRFQHLWERHSPSVRRRFELEWQIVKALVRAALDAGLTLNVNNGGEEDECGLSGTRDVRVVLGAMFETDDETLLLYRNGGCVGWVKLIYGNDGYDVISDHSANELTESLMAEPNKISEKYW
jgi:hypothetical protein